MHKAQLRPRKDSIKFKGKIYLLVDKKVFSSSEKLASFAKESGLATLVECKTGGDGIGSDPYLIALPNNGYILRFTKELGVTSKGRINEVDKTEPDIDVNALVNVIEEHDRIIWDKDDCIKAVMLDLGIEEIK